MKVVIMAGGKGTRIASLASDIPKPMIKINRKPILEHEIECLKQQGFTDLIITVSHMSAVIMDYFGDGGKVSPVTGETFGVHIEYFVEEVPLGNAGALFKLKDKLDTEFLLLNADVAFDVDFKRMLEFHKEKDAVVTLFTHPNSHPYDSGLLIADENKSVKAWITKEENRPNYYKNRVNAGLHIISSRIFDMVDIDVEQIGSIEPTTGKTVKVDLDRQILKPLAGTGFMFCYDSSEYVKDMGTPERFHQVETDYKSGIVQARSFINKQKAIFLDRDGTINKYVGFLRRKEEFELLPAVADAIKKINHSEYLCIVITNQPVIARGEVTFEELQIIHNKMETELGYEGAYIDALYFCPHHPHRGYEGEIPELKIECTCRKPKPGLLLQAAEEYNIDLSASWMIGDSENDILAGKIAGCSTGLICNKEEVAGSVFGQDVSGKDLYDVVEYVLLANM